MSGELLFWLNLLVGVGIYTLLALSLNLINGHAGMFHLGHHGFWALGAYAAVWLARLLGSPAFLEQYDLDQDGIVTIAEYREAGFRELDRDKDGVVSGAEAGTSPEGTELLRRYDGDGDGQVTLAEFRGAPGASAPPAEVPFARIDTDGNMVLSGDELERAFDHPVNYVASLLLAVVVAAVGGFVVGIPCLRLRGDYLAIATLGFAEIVRIAVQNSPPDVLGGSLGVKVPRALMHVGPTTIVPFRMLTLAIVALACAAVIVAFRNFLRSMPGRHLLAVAQDETAAGLLGIHPTRSKVTAFVIGAAVAGLAGGLYANYQGFITPLDFGFMEMVKMFLIIVLGGMGSLSGCVVGAFLVVATEQLLNRAPEQVAAWWQVEFPLILALMIIFRPQGIFGRREFVDVLRGWLKRPA